eukprot:6176865-Pleurochrysis_carterae.AAC.1
MDSSAKRRHVGEPLRSATFRQPHAETRAKQAHAYVLLDAEPSRRTPHPSSVSTVHKKRQAHSLEYEIIILAFSTSC